MNCMCANFAIVKRFLPSKDCASAVEISGSNTFHGRMEDVHRINEILVQIAEVLRV